MSTAIHKLPNRLRCSPCCTGCGQCVQCCAQCALLCSASPVQAAARKGCRPPACICRTAVLAVQAAVCEPTCCLFQLLLHIVHQTEHSRREVFCRKEACRHCTVRAQAGAATGLHARQAVQDFLRMLEGGQQASGPLHSMLEPLLQTARLIAAGNAG